MKHRQVAGVKVVSLRPVDMQPVIQKSGEVAAVQKAREHQPEQAQQQAAQAGLLERAHNEQRVAQTPGALPGRVGDGGGKHPPPQQRRRRQAPGAGAAGAPDKTAEQGSAAGPGTGRFLDLKF